MSIRFHFCLFADIEDLPNEVRKQLFEELLDNNAQKGLVDISIEFIAKTQHLLILPLT